MTTGGNKFDGADILPTVQGMAPSPHADSVLINAEMHRGLFLFLSPPFLLPSFSFLTSFFSFLGAVRMGDFKIVKKATLPSRVEVYNLRTDPGEANNLYGMVGFLSIFIFFSSCD